MHTTEGALLELAEAMKSLALAVKDMSSTQKIVINRLLILEKEVEKLKKERKI